MKINGALVVLTMISTGWLVVSLRAQLTAVQQLQNARQ
jgi:hypothetical protein